MAREKTPHKTVTFQYGKKNEIENLSPLTLERLSMLS